MSAEDLYAAATANDLVSMKVLLLRDKVDINSMDDNWWTALHYATQAGSYEAVFALLQHNADPTIVRLCFMSRVASRC
mgnify:CR=1 FL=1